MGEPIPVAVIGAGPAGISTALQLARFHIPAVVFEKKEPGGLLYQANFVENFTGISQGIRGSDLAVRMRDHLLSCGVETIRSRVTGLEYRSGEYRIHHDSGQITAGIAVIASGTRPLVLQSGSGQLDQALIHYDIQPLLSVSGCSIVVIGSGDAAFDYALNLADANQVRICIRGQRAKCVPLLMKRAGLHDRIEIRYLNTLRSIRTSSSGMEIGMVTGKGMHSRISCDFLLSAIGREPVLNFVDPELKRGLNSRKQAGDLFLIGDVVNGRYRQAVIAAGDGVRCAMMIADQLHVTEKVNHD
jgi:thioredoxin reductase